MTKKEVHLYAQMCIRDSHTGVSSDSLCNMKGKLQHHGYDSELILS